LIAFFLEMPISEQTDRAVIAELHRRNQAVFRTMKPEEVKVCEEECLDKFHRKQKKYHEKHLTAETEQEPEPQTIWQRIKAKTSSAGRGWLRKIKRRAYFRLWSS
jgi:hypothetical protein